MHLHMQYVGWWSPTVIRGDEREAVHIPNHKFSVSVVRNLTQKTHWRIKTHIGISHLDVNKISVSSPIQLWVPTHPSIQIVLLSLAHLLGFTKMYCMQGVISQGRQEKIVGVE